MLGQYLTTGHDRFLPHPSQFIIQNHPPIRLYATYEFLKSGS